MPQEPSQIEIFITRMVGNIFPGFYREYVFHLPITGHEQIMDFGSGSGNCSKYLAKRLSGNGHLTCVDISCRWQNEIRKRLRKYTNVSFRLGDLETLNFAECSFDAILIHYVLHDIPQPQRKSRVALLATLLKPGGKVFIREPQNPDHGISDREIQLLVQQAGLSEMSSNHGEHKFAGKYYQAIYRR